MAPGLARAAFVWLALAASLAWQPCGGVALHTRRPHRRKKANDPFQPSGKSLQHPISKIFYINLANSTARREEMERVLGENADGVPFERFEAVTKEQGLEQSPYKDIVQAQNVSSAFLSPNNSFRLPGAVACYMSHRFLLEHISRLPGDQDAVYVVLEDDVNVTKGWTERLASIWPSIPDNWDLLKLGYVGTEWPCDEIAQGVYVAKLAGGKSRSLGCNTNYLGTQTYAVSPRSAARVLKVLYNTEVRDIDSILCTGMQCAHRIPGKATPFVFALVDMKQHFTANPDIQKNSTIGKANLRGSSEECRANLTALKPGELDCALLRQPKNRSGPFDTHPTLPLEHLHSGWPYVDDVLHEMFPDNGNS